MNEMTRYEDSVLARGWAHVQELLTAILGLVAVVQLASGFTPARASLLAKLRRAESLARRLLLILALRLPPPATPARAFSTPKQQDIKPNTPASRERAPAFRLIEPAPSLTIYSPPGRFLQPRIRFLDEPCPPPASAPVRPCPLQRRIRALRAVLEHRRRAASRLARWFARRRHGLRFTPLKIGKPPGRLPGSDIFYDLIREAHHIACDALDRRRRRNLASS